MNSQPMDAPKSRQTPFLLIGQSAWFVPLILLLSTGTLLGVSTNLAKLAVDVGLSPLAFLTWSLLGSATLLTLLAVFRRRLPALNRQTLEYFVIAGLVSVVAPNLLFFSAIAHVGVGFVALAITFPPLLTYVAALVFGLERFRTVRALGVVLALVGAFILALLKFAEPNAAPFWIIATLCGPLFLAVGNIYRSLRWPAGAASDMLAPGMLAAAALQLLMVGLFVHGVFAAPAGLSLTVPMQSSAPLLVILAQIATFSVQYLLFFALQKHGGPVYLSLLGSVGAIIGVPLAVMFFGESIPPGLAVGGTLIALGIGLLTVGGLKQR